MQKVLLTGGAGYIGSVLTDALLRANYAVTVFDNLMYNCPSLLGFCYNSSFRVVVGDVRDSSLLKSELTRHDVVIPLAAIVGAPSCEIQKDLATMVNVDQIRFIVNNISRDQKILLPVSNSGYGIGINGILCDENSPLNPISHYGRTKVEAETILLENTNGIAFRLATVFGASPRVRLDLLVNNFVHKAIHDRYLVLFEAKFKRNFLHIRDACSVFLHAVDNYAEMQGNCYNVGMSSANIDKLALCGVIKKHIPKFVFFESAIGADPDKRDYIVSNQKIEATGFETKYDLDDGVQELIKAFSLLKDNTYSNT